MAMIAALEAVDLPGDAIEVGRIAQAWGLLGWFKVDAHSASPEALFSSKRWYLQASSRNALAFEGTRKLAIEQARAHAGGIVAKAHDVTDRSAALALRGSRIFVPRSSFPTPGLDEYYWVDLVGLSVCNRQGAELGTVSELLSAGPQTVLVLVFDADGRQQERLIPFVAAYVDTVDLAGRRITVDWQPDY